jgi:hypothetical protein
MEDSPHSRTGEKGRPIVGCFVDELLRNLLGAPVIGDATEDETAKYQQINKGNTFLSGPAVRFNLN